MNPILEQNYHDDILKVNKLCKDLKQCDKDKDALFRNNINNSNGSNINNNNSKKIKPSNNPKKVIKNTSSSCLQLRNTSSKEGEYYLHNNYNSSSSSQQVSYPKKKKKSNNMTTVYTSSGNKGYNSNKQMNDDDVDVVEFSTSGPKEKQLDKIPNQFNVTMSSPTHHPAAKQNNLYQEIHKLNKTIEQKDIEISLLRVTNQRSMDKIAELQKMMQNMEQLLSKMKSREMELLGETCKLTSKQLNFEYGKVEYENFRNDSKRLLKMLQMTNEYQAFAQLALDVDDGVRFLNSVNKSKKSKVDLYNSTTSGKTAPSSIHFCTCNKAFLPQSGFWVPRNAYQFGREFIKDRKGELSQGEFELLLYELNKIWREREKKIMNSMNSLKALEVDKLKRKINNNAKSGAGRLTLLSSLSPSEQVKLDNYEGYNNEENQE